jgi:predicted nucleic acid-binding protein
VRELVVDASVAAKWYLPEIHADLALGLLDGSHLLAAPDLLYAEVGNILWKRVRHGDITEEDATAIFQNLGSLPLIWHPLWPLSVVALEIACRTGRTLYDSVYLALAVQENVPVVTADQRFYNALQGSTLTAFILWIEDL